MLIITPPLLKGDKIETRVECTIAIDGHEEVLYYSTPIEWDKYLTFERADAFLLGVLQYAMKEGHDIEVQAPISERLYFNLVNQVIPLLSAGFGHKRIQLKCGQLDNRMLMVDDEKPFAVGTGCSLGVDSFGSILYHLQPDAPPNFRLTHLTYFNVGALGNDTEKATASYEHDLPMIQEYATFKQMPLVKISSNIGKLYEGWNFDHCHLTRNSATVLVFQKLFRRYFYASSSDVSHLHLSNQATGYYETSIMPYLSTENTDLLIGQAAFSRVDKTKFIAAFPETYSRLYVCWREILKNNYNDNRSNVEVLNCGRCEKCRRTMLSLHFLNKEEQYKDIFDWDYFHKRYHFAVGYALANRKRKVYYEDVVELMKQSGYKPSLVDRFWQLGLSIYYFFR